MTYVPNIGDRVRVKNAGDHVGMVGTIESLAMDGEIAFIRPLGAQKRLHRPFIRGAAFEPCSIQE